MARTMPSEFKPGVIQPGMSQIIEAGDTLEITDKDGQKFAVEAVEGSATLEFLALFDNWLTMKKAGVEGVVIESTYQSMVDKFINLPMRIQRALPSFKKIVAGT